MSALQLGRRSQQGSGRLAEEADQAEPGIAIDDVGLHKQMKV